MGQLHLPKIQGKKRRLRPLPMWVVLGKPFFESKKNAFQSHRTLAESMEEGSNHKIGWSHSK